MEAYSFIYLFMLAYFLSDLRNHFLIQIRDDLHLCFLFTDVALTFWSLIHVELNFVHSVRQRFHFILLHVNIQLFQHHLLKRLFFSPLDGPGSLVKNQLALDILVYFQTLSYIPLTYVSIVMSVSDCLDYFVVSGCVMSFKILLYN